MKLAAAALAACGVMLCAEIPFAQERPPAVPLAELSLEDLTKVTVISGARHEQNLWDSPRFISVVTAETIRMNNYRTVPEALNEIAGVFVQETNYAGGSPIIRGLIGNQILILLDGVRLNTGTYRLGPNQYLNTIDIHSVERIEVLHGPGSVLYGSDALGGVINIISKSRPGTLGPGIEGRVVGRVGTADRSGVGRLELSGGAKRFSLIGGVSLEGFGDLRAGDATGLQRNTGYHERDGDLTLSVTLSPRQRLTAAWQHVRQDGASRTDAIASGTDLEYRWNPETRSLGRVAYTIDNPASFAQRLTLTGSFQVQSEWIDRITAAKPSVERHSWDQTRSVGAAAQVTSAIGARHLLTYGVEAYVDHVTSQRQDDDLLNGVSTGQPGTFADGSSYSTVGAFFQDEITATDRLDVAAGLRFSLFDINATVHHAVAGTLDLRSRPSALTGSVNAAYRLTSHLTLLGGVAQGFRAPNIDDTTIFGSFGSGFEVPNPSLEPERSVEVETGIRASSARVTGELVGFVSRYQHLIQREAALFRDLPFLDANDNGVRDPKEEAIYQRRNMGRSQIAGLEARMKIQLTDRLLWTGNIGWTRGDDLAAGGPLRRIPPVKGTLALRWTSAGGAWLEGFTSMAGRQDRLASGDLTDPRIRRTGTSAFATVNLRGGFDAGPHVRVAISGENLLDTTYRMHGSGLDAPGRTLLVGTEWRF